LLLEHSPGLEATEEQKMKIAVISIATLIAITVAKGQELPKYPIRNSDDQMLYDSLATTWDSDSPTARQCALDRLKSRHITKTYLNLMEALTSCGRAELEEQ
jgi:hypothetical protein